MAGRLSQLIDTWCLRKVQALWARSAEAAPAMAPPALRALRGEARAMRRQIDRVLQAADQRLTQPAAGAPLPPARLGTDWAWRPDLWRGPVAVPGAIAAGARTALGDDVALYHDCPLGEIILRQIRNRQETHRAPCGVVIETFGFAGSFLSLALRLPDQACAGLRARHVVRLDAVIESDRPVAGFARLNIKHGPNVAQLVSRLPAASPDVQSAFDLAYAGLDESRIEKMWLDLIFEAPAMSGITLRDVTMARHPRAEV